MRTQLHRSVAWLVLSVGAWCQTTEPATEEPSYPRITTRGQIQIQHDDGSRGAARGDDPQAVLNGIGAFPAEDTIEIRRMRLVTSLQLSEDVSINNETNFDTRSDTVSVLDLYLRAQFGERYNMRAGLFKIPFGWEGLRSSRTTNTIEMSDVTRALSNFRDSGLAGGFQQDGWDVNVAVVQGQGGVWSDANGGKDFVARVTYDVNDNLSVGGSVHLGTHRPINAAGDVPVRRAGLELQYHDAPWRLEAEYLWSDGYNFVSRRDTVADGFYIALIYTLDARNDVLVHFDRFEPDLRKADFSVPSNDANTRNRLVIGWNHYLQREPEHRFMVNYEIANEEEGPRVSNNGFRIRYQYAW